MSIGVCSFRVRGGGGNRSYFSERVPSRLSPCQFFGAWKLPWKERPINLLSSLLGIPRCVCFWRPSQLSTTHAGYHTLLDPIQLLCGVTSGEPHAYHYSSALNTVCFRGDIYTVALWTFFGRTRPIRYVICWSITPSSHERSSSLGFAAVPHTRKLVHQHRFDSGSRNERLTGDRGEISPPLSAVTIVIAALNFCSADAALIMAIVVSYAVVRHTSYTFTYDHPKQPLPVVLHLASINGGKKRAATVSNVIPVLVHQTVLEAPVL